MTSKYLSCPSMCCKHYNTYGLFILLLTLVVVEGSVGLFTGARMSLSAAPVPGPILIQPKTLPAFQDPSPDFKAVLIGPVTASPGDLIVLDASKSIGVTKYSWSPAGHSGGFLEVDDGERIVMAYGSPGRYTFVLACAGIVGDTLQLDQLVHTIVVGKPAPPKPAPGPVPPVPPSRFGLTEVARKIAVEVNNPEGAAILANNYDAISSAISAGAYRVVDEAFEAVAEKNRESLSAEQKNIWSNFAVQLPEKFKELFEQKVVHTLPQLAEAFLEVAKGLR